MVLVLTRVEDYLHSEIKRGMIKERRERGPAASGWGVGNGGGRGLGGVARAGGGSSLREQWRNNVQIAVSDAHSATQVSWLWTSRLRYSILLGAICSKYIYL